MGLGDYAQGKEKGEGSGILPAQGRREKLGGAIEKEMNLVIEETLIN